MKHKPKILFGYKFDEEGFKELEKDFELIYPQNHYFSRDEVISLIPHVEVFVPSFAYRTDKAILEQAHRLKLIANYGVGYDNIDVSEASSRGIVVTNTPESVLEPTAELCFALILDAMRKVSYYNLQLRSAEGMRWRLYSDLGMGLEGKTLGIFGMGRIGQAVARRAIAFGMQVMYHNRRPLPAEVATRYDARYVDFDSLLLHSDVLVLSAPATPDTYKIFGMEQFLKMKKQAVFINIARGSLVDEQALIKALQDGEIANAGLDVFDKEPHIPSELLDMPQVVVAPHAGTKTLEARLAMQQEVARNIVGFYRGDHISRVLG